MFFFNKMIRKVKPFKIYVDNILIEQVAKTKFLGVIITDHHINTVCSKVSKGIGIFCKFVI